MKKSTAPRKVEWLLMPGSQRDTAMLATVMDIPSLRNLDPFADVKEDEDGLEENELVLEDC